jgi:UDP-GlcNAc:undecaprenyl-phosphate GlcNAc-1-phosphate transferase
VHALPFVVAFAAALVLAPALRRTLDEEGLVRENFRGHRLPFPFGVLIVFAAVIALVVVAPLDQVTDGDVLMPELGLIALYALGVACLGLADDVLSGASRGWRGHGAEVLRGRVSTGALKAVGSLGLALLVLRGRHDYLLSVAVLVLATNLFNLLDLRPGRAVKAFVLLGAGLTLGAWDADPLWALGLFAAPVLVAASTTSASGPCSATPAPTWSARWAACGSCSRCRPPASPSPPPCCSSSPPTASFVR